MNKKLPAAVLSLLLYAQLGFGIVAVAAVVYDRSPERHTVVTTDLADAGTSAIGILR